MPLTRRLLHACPCRAPSHTCSSGATLGERRAVIVLRLLDHVIAHSLLCALLLPLEPCDSRDVKHAAAAACLFLLGFTSWVRRTVILIARPLLFTFDE